MKRILVLLVILSLGAAVSSCGIKGAPVPPQQPFFIGDGDKKIKSASDQQKDDKKQIKKKSEFR